MNRYSCEIWVNAMCWTIEVNGYTEEDTRLSLQMLLPKADVIHVTEL